jgi:glyoxylase-like metal-dependent hydrolase (beta-lactamase superfamily II)
MLVHQIAVGETNCYLLQSDGGTVLIDPGPPKAAPAVIARARACGVQPGDVRLILVTHGHLDHYGAAQEVKAWCGAPVAATHGEPAFSQDRRHALPPAQTLRGSIIRWLYLLLSPLFPFAPLEADLALDDGADLGPYGVAAKVFLMPGHSPGSLAAVTAQGDAFVGDLIVNYGVPSQPIYLSDRKAWQSSCKRLRELEPRTVYVGHGDPFPGDRLDYIYPARYQLRWWVR